MQLKVVHVAVKKGTENSTATKVLDLTGKEVGALVSLSIVGPPPDSFELVIETPEPAASAPATVTTATAAKQ